MSRVPTTEGPERPGILLLAGATLLAGCRTPPAPREVATPDDASPAPAAAPVLEDQLGGRWAIGDVLAGPAFIIVGGVGASERSTRWDLEVVGPLALRADAELGLAMPQVVVRFAGRDVATWGRPFVLYTLGADLRF